MDYTDFMSDNFISDLNNIPNFSLLLIAVCGLLLVLLIVQKIRFSMKIKNERQDAVSRSRAVIAGQTAEQVAPFLKGFPCNPGDVKFIGKPVDFVAFPGLLEKNEVSEILFIEVKTGSSVLSAREKEIKKAVEEGRVRYVEYNPSN